jgi:hypothetical protein
MKSPPDSNWAWKPPKGVPAAINRGNLKTDPCRELKARRAAMRKELDNVTRQTS